jgi:hypothetical protein
MSPLADRIDDALRPNLLAAGFERVRPRRWVSCASPPIHRIFEFQALKGATYSARWGFSLDFVPALRGGRLRWKRTCKTADFDLCIDPTDEFGDTGSWCSVAEISGWKDASAAQINQVVVEAIRKAHEDFARGASVADLVALLRERAQMRFRRFSLENYVQTHIAWGLSLIAVGNPAEGATHLELFCDRYGIDRDDRILRQAERDATGAAETPGA